jgi:hypothetical protein
MTYLDRLEAGIARRLNSESIADYVRDASAGNARL